VPKRFEDPISPHTVVLYGLEPVRESAPEALEGRGDPGFLTVSAFGTKETSIYRAHTDRSYTEAKTQGE
jgi:hypothetical protein